MHRRRFLRACLLPLPVLALALPVPARARQRDAKRGGAPADADAAARPRLGMNLEGPSDWNCELPFVDVFRLSRTWISQRKGAAWGKGPALELDESGWVKRLEPDCFAETPLCTIEGGHYPAGEYTVLYDGRGELDFLNAEVVSSRPGRLVIRPDPRRGGFFLRIRATNPSDYVRNIRVIMPGFAATYAKEPFHPAFLERWRGVASLRFMDWMHTNNSEVATWDDRPKATDATWTQRGIPLEVMIDVSNRVQADPWFCMPHLADDDYVRRFAATVKERLAPDRKVYVEYSNEVWNGQFAQSRWAGAQGVKLGLGAAEKPWEAGWRFTARRSVQVFKIWESVFGGTGRLVRVLPSQAANPYVSEQIVSFEDAYKHADALAVAPYVSCNVGPNTKPGLAEVERWTVDQALDHLEKSALPESLNWIKGQKAVADKYGLKLVAYEGGQHMVGIQGGENSEALTRLLHAANAHPRMGAIYARYLDGWAAAGGDLFCYFSSTGRWSKWGSWSLLQTYDEDPAKSPKYVATMRWAAKQGQKVHLPR